MMEATLEDSVKKVREWRDYYISRLPKGLSDSEFQVFQTQIAGMLGDAELFIKLIYDAGMALGENLSGLMKYSNNKRYRFFLEGIGRHLLDGPEQVKQANIFVRETEQNRDLSKYIDYRYEISMNK